MKKAAFSMLIFAALGGLLVTLAFRTTTPQPNAVLINDAIMTIATAESENISEFIPFLTEQLTYAFEEMDSARQSRDSQVQLFMYIFIAALFVLAGALLLYCEVKILSPFRKLQGFARSIADGNLDVPLAMDKNNTFGAFTESFDIMREELRKANHSKKELVASLSHDIKTPIASIKAVTELMLVKTADEKELARLNTITAKAEQVNALITNMFHATLEELEVLNVAPEEVSSAEIATLINNADYQRQATVSEIPTCLVIADLLRLQQVFDNVISNSYKYANTSIMITVTFEGQYLAIDIQDFGTGVIDKDLTRLFDKFYRGDNKDKVGGQGLGLFISKYFMTQMHGDIVCRLRLENITVKVFVKLA